MEEKRLKFEEEELVRVLEEEERKNPEIVKKKRLEGIIRLKNSWRTRRERKSSEELKEPETEDLDSQKLSPEHHTQSGISEENLSPEKPSPQNQKVTRILHQKTYSTTLMRMKMMSIACSAC